MTWTTCECGCGWEGEDDVTQWCIEEAIWERYRISTTPTETDGDPDVSPGERQAAQHAMKMAELTG